MALNMSPQNSPSMFLDYHKCAPRTGLPGAEAAWTGQLQATAREAAPGGHPSPLEKCGKRQLSELDLSAFPPDVEADVSTAFVLGKPTPTHLLAFLTSTSLSVLLEEETGSVLGSE